MQSRGVSAGANQAVYLYPTDTRSGPKYCVKGYYSTLDTETDTETDTDAKAKAVTETETEKKKAPVSVMPNQLASSSPSCGYITIVLWVIT